MHEMIQYLPMHGAHGIAGVFFIVVSLKVAIKVEKSDANQF